MIIGAHSYTRYMIKSIAEYYAKNYNIGLDNNEVITDCLMYGLLYVKDILPIPKDKKIEIDLNFLNTCLYNIMKKYYGTRYTYKLLSYMVMVRYGKIEQRNEYFEQYIRLKLSGKLYDLSITDSVYFQRLNKTSRNDSFVDVIKFILTGDKQILSSWEKMDNLIWNNEQIFKIFNREIFEKERTVIDRDLVFM